MAPKILTLMKAGLKRGQQALEKALTPKINPRMERKSLFVYDQVGDQLVPHNQRGNFTKKSKFAVIDGKTKQPLFVHDIIPNPTRPTNPDVVICTGKNPKTGKIEPQTMPLDKVDKMWSPFVTHPKLLNFTSKSFRTTTGSVLGIGILSYIYCAERPNSHQNNYSYVPDSTIVQNAMNTINFSEDMQATLVDIKHNGIKFEPKTSDTPTKVMTGIHNVLTDGRHGIRYLQSLADNKESLMKDLNLTSKEYDELADIAMRIISNETSFGESPKYRFMMTAEEMPFVAFGASKVREKKSGSPELSRGMSQYKICMASDEEKAIFEKYGISSDNLSTNIGYPEEAATATVIHLAHIKKGYKEYARKTKEQMPDLTNPDVQASITNAKAIVENDELRPKAMKALTQLNGTEEETQALKDANLTQKDLDDLRIYARTILLSEKAFTGAGWNGKRVRAYDETKFDRTCANLLEFTAGVGYISKIDTYNPDKQ